MNLTYQLNQFNTRYSIELTILRIILGISLAIRGIYFLNNMPLLNQVITGSSLGSLNITNELTFLITWLHLLGGTFIILGLFTRIAVWPQIPILLGAIIFINTSDGIFGTFNDLLFSILVLVLLVIFAIEGGGKVSMDEYLKKYIL